MSSDFNRVEYWGYSSKNDIRISLADWHEMTDALKDSRFTAEGLMKFKNLYKNIYHSMIAISIMSFIPGYFINKVIFPNVYRSHSGYKITWPFLATFYFMSFHKFATTPVPRRIHTDIFTDEGPDGTYVRSELKKKQPHLWTFISKQLHEKNYTFPELNENIGYEFPSALLN